MSVDYDRLLAVGSGLPVAPPLETNGERPRLGRLELEQLLAGCSGRALPGDEVVFTSKSNRRRQLGDTPQITAGPVVGEDDHERLARSYVDAIGVCELVHGGNRARAIRPRPEMIAYQTYIS
jgi:hypothetical protein